MAKEIQKTTEEPLKVQLTTLQFANDELKEKLLALEYGQQQLIKENEKLTRINDDLSNFVYAASHDLLGPLGNIEASLSGIQRRATDADFDVYLQVIDSSVKKFSALIKNLAIIARLESDMSALEWIDLNEVIAHVKWTIEHKMESVGATIITDFEVDKILFSKNNLHSILYNLISNSIKFKGNEPPVIRVITKDAGDSTILIVQDNGKGIPAVALEKIFKIYSRLNHDIEGSGIGLYLAKKLINSSGGQIQVRSEEGKGSDFIIRFQNTPIKI